VIETMRRLWKATAVSTARISDAKDRRKMIPAVATMVFMVMAASPDPSPASGITGESSGERVITSSLAGLVVEAETLGRLGQVKIALDSVRVTYTDSTGFFEFADLPPGRHTLSASRFGFTELKYRFALAAGEKKFLSLHLEENPIVLKEVEVRGRRAHSVLVEPRRVLSSGEIRRSLGGFTSDPVRAVSSLPGVAATLSDASAYYVVRGGAPDENLVSLDGTPILKPFHLSGIVSTVNNDVLESAQVYAAAFPLRYGNALSSVVDLLPSEAGERSVRLKYDFMNMAASFTGPLSDKAWLASSFRSTFYNLVVGPWIQEGSPHKRYRDGLVHLVVKASPGHVFRLSFLNSRDILELTPEDSPGFTLTDGADQVILHGEHGPWGGVAVGTYAWIGRERMQGALPDTSVDELVGVGGARLLLDWKIAPLVSVAAGSEVGRSVHEVLSDRDGSSSWSAFAGASVGRAGGLSATAGLRVEKLPWVSERTLSPRLALQETFGKRLTLKLGYRVVWQQPYYFINNPYLAVFDPFRDAPHDADLGLKPRRAEHVYAGLLLDLPASFRLAVEGYRKRYENLPERMAGAAGEEGYKSDGRGRARGLELSLVREAARGVGLRISYAWSRSRKTMPGVEGFVPDRFDVPHSLVVEGRIPVSQDATFSAEYRLASGRPYTPVLEEAGTGGEAVFRTGEALSARTRAYRRLDLRIEVRIAERDELWGRRVFSEGTLYFEVLNVFNRANVMDRVESIVEGRKVRREIMGDSMLPLVGVQIRFF